VIDAASRLSRGRDAPFLTLRMGGEGPYSALESAGVGFIAESGGGAGVSKNTNLSYYNLFATGVCQCKTLPFGVDSFCKKSDSRLMRGPEILRVARSFPRNGYMRLFCVILGDHGFR